MPLFCGGADWRYTWPGLAQRCLGGSPAPFARDDLVLVGKVGMGANEERLKDALGADRFDKSGEVVRIEIAPWLIAAGMEQLDGELANRSGAVPPIGCRLLAEQGREPSAKAPLVGHAALSLVRSRFKTSPARCM